MTTSATITRTSTLTTSATITRTATPTTTATITGTRTITATPTITTTRVPTTTIEADIDSALGGELNAYNGAVVVKFPPGAASTNLRVRFEPPTKDKEQERYRQQVLYRFSLRAFDRANLKQEVTQFKKAISMTLRYDAKALKAWREQDLMLVYWDANKKRWQPLPSKVDTTRHSVTAETTHFTDFGLTAGPDVQSYLPSLQSAEPNLFLGSAATEYAIEMPPGRNGLMPRLSLSYSSTGVDMVDEFQQASFVGAGWSFTTNYIGRNTRGTYDSADDVFTLILNGAGQDLMLDAASTTTYHTASEQYWRIIYDPTNDRWTVTTNDGTQYQYGYSTGSRAVEWRINEQRSKKQETYAWYLEKAIDTHGNEIAYAYRHDTNTTDCGEAATLYTYDDGVYPLNIRYNGTVQLGFATDITFTYSARTDFHNYATKYQCAVPLPRSKLDRIDVRTKNESGTLVQVRAYTFAYDYSTFPGVWSAWPSNQFGRLTLKSITRLGSDGTALPPYTLTYSGNRLWKVDNGIGGSTSFTYTPTVFGAVQAWRYMSGWDFSGCAVWGNCSSAWSTTNANANPGTFGSGGAMFISSNGGYFSLLWGRFIPSALQRLGTSVYWVGANVDVQVTAFDGVSENVIRSRFTCQDPSTPCDASGNFWVSDAASTAEIRIYVWGTIAIQGANLTAYPTYYRVANRVLDDGQGNSSTFAYAYEGAALNDPTTSAAAATCCNRSPAYNQFRGHSKVTVTDPTGAKTENYFRQDDAVLGRLWQVIQLDSNNLKYTRTEHTYTLRSIPISAVTTGEQSNFVSVSTTLRETWDAQASPKTTKTNYWYDAYGNLRQTDEYRDATTAYTFSDPFDSANTAAWTFSPYQTVPFNDAGQNVVKSTGTGVDWNANFYRNANLTSGQSASIDFKVDNSNTASVYAIESYDGGAYFRWAVIAGSGKIYVQYLINYPTLGAVYPQDLINPVKLNTWYRVTLRVDDVNGFKIEIRERDSGGATTGYTYPMPAGKTWKFHHWIWQNTAYLDNYAEATDNTATNLYRSTRKTFYPNTSAWVLNKVDLTQVFDGNNVRLSETRYFYDGSTNYTTPPTKGDLTRVDVTADGTNFFTSLTNTYDAYGNVKTATDALNLTTTTNYDTTYNIFPTSVTNPLNQITTNTYDYRFGKLASTTDPNNATTSYAYDVFGRTKQIWAPNEQTYAPTAQYTYTWTAPRPLVQVQVRRDLGGANAAVYQNAWWFYDGLGRTIQRQTQGLNGQLILANTSYNNLGRLWRTSNPYSTSAAGGTYQTPVWDTAHPYTQHAYDPIGRETTTTNPDGTTTTTVYTIVVNEADGDFNQGGRLAVYVYDANNHITRQSFDAFANVLTVTEFFTGGEYRTHYTYDRLNRLTDVWDASSNNTHMTYDWLGRKTAMTDPDMGSWSYGYDNVGNLTRQTDAKNQTTCLYYDAINRLKGKNYRSDMACPADPGSGYTVWNKYDEATSTNGKGRRTSMSDPSGSSIWNYDKQGRVITQTNSINGAPAPSYITNWSYDAMNRARSMTYPDSEVVPMTYNDQGLLSTLGSYVINSNYNAASQLLSMNFGNAAATSFTYDPANLRLTQLQTQSLWCPPPGRGIPCALQNILNLNYTYDNVGNVKTITDTMRSETSTFTYDDLNRLQTASIPNVYSQAWTYGPVGNIGTRTDNGVTTSYAYTDPAHKHAATQMGSNAYSYDANGSMITRTLGSSAYFQTWDPENRLSAVLSDTMSIHMAYDGDGQRVRKTEYTLQTPLLIDTFDSANTSVWTFSISQTVPFNDGGQNVVKSVGTGVDWNSNFYRNANLTSGQSASIDFKVDATDTVTHLALESYDGGAYFRWAVIAGNGKIYVQYLINYPTLGAVYPQVLINPVKLNTWYRVTLRVDDVNGFKIEVRERDGGNASGSYSFQMPAGKTWKFHHWIWRNTAYLDNYVERTDSSRTTYYVGNHYEVSTPPTATTKYYYFGAQRVAMNQGGAVTSLHGDHLGSTSVAVGATISTQVYYPFGAVRAMTGTLPTDFTFTGQKFDASDGLMYYGARYYDAALSRFLSADTIIPNLYNPQDLNRYTYTRNNPLRYTDPNGHVCLPCLIFGAVLLAGYEYFTHPHVAYAPAPGQENLGHANPSFVQETVDVAKDAAIIQASGQAIGAGLGYGVGLVRGVLARGAIEAGEEVAETAVQRAIPLGFKNAEEFAEFGSTAKSGLKAAGYEDAEIYMRGSSVTGKSFETGEPFDVGRVSDFDLAVASPKLLQRAKDLGIGLRGGGVRTGPLTQSQLQRLGLSDLSEELSSAAGRDVNFMIYDSAEKILDRGPAIFVPE